MYQLLQEAVGCRSSGQQVKNQLRNRSSHLR
jgi:hypothetical protein